MVQDLPLFVGRRNLFELGDVHVIGHVTVRGPLRVFLIEPLIFIPLSAYFSDLTLFVLLVGFQTEVHSSSAF